MAQVKLITDVLANGLDKSYRENLISNFKIIESTLNQLVSDEDKKDSESEKNQSELFDKLSARINRIVLGTDEDAIRLVVTEILKEQGVIK